MTEKDEELIKELEIFSEAMIKAAEDLRQILPKGSYTFFLTGQTMKAAKERIKELSVNGIRSESELSEQT